MTPGTKNGGYRQTPQTSDRQGLYRVRFSDYEKSIHEKRVQQLNNQIIQNIKKAQLRLKIPIVNSFYVKLISSLEIEEDLV